MKLSDLVSPEELRDAMEDVKRNTGEKSALEAQERFKDYAFALSSTMGIHDIVFMMGVLEAIHRVLEKKEAKPS